MPALAGSSSTPGARRPCRRPGRPASSGLVERGERHGGRVESGERADEPGIAVVVVRAGRARPSRSAVVDLPDADAVRRREPLGQPVCGQLDRPSSAAPSPTGTRGPATAARAWRRDRAVADHQPTLRTSCGSPRSDSVMPSTSSSERGQVGPRRRTARRTAPRSRGLRWIVLRRKLIWPPARSTVDPPVRRARVVLQLRWLATAASTIAAGERSVTSPILPTRRPRCPAPRDRGALTA